MNAIRTFFRGLLYLVVLLLFSPLIIPALVIGLVWSAIFTGFSVGNHLLTYFLLGFKVRTTAGPMPSGVAFSTRHPKGRRG